jgi:surface polysaccharide O-acyltransferase-like enzyme
MTGFFAFLLRIYYPVGGKNIIGLQLGYFVRYIAMYWLGIISGRRKWLDKLQLSTYRWWILAAFLMMPTIILAWISVTDNPSRIQSFTGGLNFNALYLAYWEALLCFGLSVFILSVFKKYFSAKNYFTASMSTDSYTAYIIHPLVLVSLTMLYEPVNLLPVYKLSIVACLSVALSFIWAHLIRLIPGMKKIL